MNHLTEPTEPATSTPDPATPAEPTELAELAAIDRRRRRGRAALAAGFALIAVAVAGPALPTIPPRAAAGAVVTALAIAGAVGTTTDGIDWLATRYTLTRPPSRRPWRWRIVRRWYAPGATVWPLDGSGRLAVLAWWDDPACTRPWVLVHHGQPARTSDRTSVRGFDRGAVWVPLTALAPAPPPAPFTRPRPDTWPGTRPKPGPESGPETWSGGGR